MRNSVFETPHCNVRHCRAEIETIYAAYQVLLLKMDSALNLNHIQLYQAKAVLHGFAEEGCVIVPMCVTASTGFPVWQSTVNAPDT